MTPDTVTNNRTKQFFFRFVSAILNIGSMQNFPAWRPTKIILVQSEKYFLYERKGIKSIFPVKWENNGETINSTYTFFSEKLEFF